MNTHVRKQVAAAVVLWVGILTAQDLVAGPPNILFIAVDDLKPALGCYGDTRAKTPNLDRLAGRGTTFLHAYCQQAVCGPSRASLLTGLRPDRIKVWDLKTKLREVNPDVVSLPEYLKQHGYETAGMGKVFDPRNVDGRATGDAPSWSVPFRPSWELPYDPDMGRPVTHYHGEEAHRLAREAASEGITTYGPLTRYLKERGAHPAVESADVPDNAYIDGALADGAIEQLRSFAGGDAPFFLAVGFKKPHLPFVAPSAYWDLYDRDAFTIHPFPEHAAHSPEFAYHNFPELRNYSGIPADGPLSPEKQQELMHGYFACVSYIDRLVGRILDEVERLGLGDDTVVLLWGDHGFHLGDHGLWTKHTNFEQATHAPLIIVAPDRPGGGKAGSPVEFVDLFPTLCELAGLETPGVLAGTSLVPMLDDPEASVKPYAVSQYPRGGRMGYSIRTDRYRFTVWVPKQDDNDIPTDLSNVEARELYDYETDPLETVNVVDDPAYEDAAATLSGRMEAFLKNATARGAE